MGFTQPGKNFSARMPVSNAQAGVDGKVLVASGDLFGLNFYPLPEAAGTILL
jgi:hypothetical protein